MVSEAKLLSIWNAASTSPLPMWAAAFEMLCWTVWSLKTERRRETWKMYISNRTFEVWCSSTWPAKAKFDVSLKEHSCRRVVLTWCFRMGRDCNFQDDDFFKHTFSQNNQTSGRRGSREIALRCLHWSSWKLLLHDKSRTNTTDHH